MDSQSKASGVVSAEQDAELVPKIAALTYKVKSHHDESYLYLDQALSCDESRQVEQAMTLYNKAVRCITQSLSAFEQLCQLQGPHTTVTGNGGLDEMIVKMRRTVAQVC